MANKKDKRSLNVQMVMAMMLWRISSLQNKQKEEDQDDTALLVWTPARESPLPTIVEEIEEMFLRLGFSQPVAMMLVDDQKIDSPRTLASLSNKDINSIHNLIRRPDGLVSGKMPDMANFCPGCKEPQACGIHVQNNRTLLKDL